MRIVENNCRKKCYLFNSALILSLIFICFISCQSLFKAKSHLPKDLSSYYQGLFSGNVVFKKKGYESYFNVHVMVADQDQLRLDLFAIFNIHVLSVFLKKTDWELILFSEKKIYKGSTLTAKKKPILENIDLLTHTDLLFFKEVLFDRLPKIKDRKCSLDIDALPKKCHNSVWTFLWNRKKHSRSIYIKKKEFYSMTFEYSFFSPVVEKTEFYLEHPSHFLVLEL